MQGLFCFLLALAVAHPVSLKAPGSTSRKTAASLSIGVVSLRNCRDLRWSSTDPGRIGVRGVLRLRGGLYVAEADAKPSRRQRVRQAREEWLKELLGGPDDRDYSNVEYKFDYHYDEVTILDLLS
jgi:hypothetical protein